MIKLSAISMALGLTMMMPAVGDPLSGMRWKNRVLVVSAASSADNKLAHQRRSFQEASNGMSERLVILIEAVGEEADAKALRQHLKLGGMSFRAVLVGKDGNVALSSAEPLSSKEIFRVIDAMPMRQDEMRRTR